MATPPTKILNVNDFAPGRYAKSRVLRDAGYEVLEAETGMQGLELANRELPALVLLDVHLPDIDGFEVCERLKSDPRTAGIAVLQISAAYVQQQHRVRGLELGADSYLVEPIENEVLLATVRALLRMRLAEQGLRRATAEWEASFNAISDAIAIVRDGVVSRCNQAFARLFSDGAQCDGKPIHDIFNARQLRFSYPSREELECEERFASELMIGDRWFGISVDPLRDAGDSSDASVCVLRDVHLHRVAEEQREKLLESERRARAFAEAARHQSEFLAEASRILGSATTEREMLGNLATLTAETLADWCFIDVRDGQNAFRSSVAARDGESEAAEALHQAVLQGANRRDALTRVLTSGVAEIFPDSMSAAAVATQSSDLSALGATSSICVPVVARGSVFGAITVARSSVREPFGANDLHLLQDVAQRVAFAVENRRLFREAQKANRAKDEFLATLSHELRTPLTSALGWTKMLKLGGLDEATEKIALDTIERSTEVQSQIVEDILDISRIVTGKLSVNMRPCSLASSIKAAVESLRPMAEQKRIEIRTSIDPSVRPVLGEQARLQQVVWNLISNAIKFTPEGGAPIEVRLTSDMNDAILTVEDQGEGIAPDFLPYVFDRFRQGDGASTREYGGLGLGLAIVRHLVELHGGSVTAASEGEKKGSRFIARFPLAPISTDVAAEALERAESARLLEGKRILLVHEERAAAEFIAASLTRSGASVRIVTNVEEGGRMLREWQADAVVCDVVEPSRGSGPVAALREASGRIDLPIVALSGYARADDRERALASGFTAHLQKPVDPIVLATEISRVGGES